MVFESIVADLLNRFLGDFVDNLDSSQLNIGIWGGDVKLENLEIKETALDDFDLPVKLKYGYLSSLVLKIPWKNLYNEPVIATIDGLNIIAVPNKGVVYNEEKAKKNAADIKQKTLARLEEARKNRRKPSDPQADSFAEKMITQIIKNLQVSISNIHVRYEDKYTNRHRPFAAGVTLQKLEFQTTDDNWIPTIHKEVVKIIHKLVLLDNLAIYWNSDAKLISDLTDKAEIKRKLQESIHAGKNKPIGYKYILEPIKMGAKLKLNQKPETDETNWKTPKIDLEVDMKAIALAIGKLQYQDVLLFLEAQERFGLAGQYLKYRPHLNEYKGKYKEWWHFAYKSILEEKVRRRRNNWSWKRMKSHRDLVRKYRDAWVMHQTEKSPSAATSQIIKDAEEKLDVFNVNVARQQAEMEIDRKGLKRLEDQPQGWVAWGKSWFGGSDAGPKPAEKKTNGKDYASQFQEAMTPEEKAKLFEAIDYQENIPPTNYPKEFVENRFDFRLNQVAIVVDGAVSMQLLHLKAHVEQRPSAGAMNLQSSVQELRMDGCGAEMLRVRDPSRMWLAFVLDTKPLSGTYDQKVQLSIAPVNLKYHAPAVNNAIDVFKPPESVKLNQLTALAMSRYEEVKARSVTGLAHAVENKSKLVLDINIEPATLMISHGGVYVPEKPTILADLGLLSIKTIDSTPTKTGHDKMSSLQEQAYDKFHVKLSNVVVTMAENFDKAKSSLGVSKSPLHILKPTGLDIQIHKSSIDDLKLPKMKILGNLPDIVVGLSDKRLLMLLRLLASIPKPEAEPEILIEDLPPVKPEGKLKDRAKMKTIMEVEEIDEASLVKTTGKDDEDEKENKSITSEQQVQIELDLHLNQIGFVLLKDEEVLCDVAILRMSCKLQMRTFDLVIMAELGAVRVGLPQFASLDPNRESCYLIDNNEQHGSLMKLKFVQANPESPFFSSEYRNTEQIVEFTFSKLNVSLHQEGLMELKRFGEELQMKMAAIEKETNAEKSAQSNQVEERGWKLSRAISDSVESLAQMTKTSQSEAAAEKRKARKERAMADADSINIKMRVEMHVGSLAILMGTQVDGCQTKLAIQNIKTDVKMTLKEMTVVASLQAITMEDCASGALYRKLLSVTGDKEMLRFEMTQFQRTEVEKKAMGPTDIDMRVKVRLAQMRFVFLNLWLCRLMGWLSPFQEEAIKAADAAKQAAAERAAEAAQNVKQLLEQSPPRIQLDVQLNAPVLIIPRLSSSNQVVVAILGNIIVSNQIIGHRDYPKAVLDKMEVKLTEMTFTIGTFDGKASRIETTCEILKPLTFAIAVQRNLTFANVKQVAEMSVDAHIPSIEMSMSEQDYATLMQTLNGNLNEGKCDEEKPVTQNNQNLPADSAESIEEVVRSASGREQPLERERKRSTMAATKHSTSQSPTSDITKKTTSFDRMVFQFKLDKIIAILYTGRSHEDRNESDAFAAMRLLHLNLAGSIKEDNAMNVQMALGAFTMNDERKGKTKISQLMDKKIGHENEQFLDLLFEQNAKQDKNVKIKMSAFYICLCPEFLGCLSRFFAVPPTDEDIDNQMTKKSTTSTATGVPLSREVDASSPPPQQPGTITMDCNMQGVEVILVENSMEPETSQALILSFNVKIDAQPSSTIQKMKGGVENLSVFSAYYASSRRSEVTYEVLKSMDIGIEMTVNTKAKATEVLLRMSPMELKMAPSIIRMLSSVNAEFAKSSTVDTNATTTVPKLKTYPDYWKNKVLNKDKYWFFQAPVAEEAEEDCSVNGDTIVEGTPVEKATVLMERISFTLEAGMGTVPVPLIYLDMLVNAEASGWSSSLKASADLSLQMSYYNEEFSVWEPVIEPIEVAPEQFERWNVKTTVKGRNKLNPLDTSPGMNVNVMAEKMLNVTVTKSFLNLLNKLSEVFAQAAKQISPPSTRLLPGHSPFILLNETGMAVKALNTETIKISSSDAPVMAPHGQFLDLSLRHKEPQSDRSDSILTASGEEVSGIVRLEIEEAVREIRVGRAEQRSVPLPKRSDGGKQWKMIAGTTLESGRRLVTLKSHISVHNHLDVPMELYSKRDTVLDMFGTVPPSSAFNLPMPPLYTATGEIYFRPANELYETSYEPITWHKFGDEPSKRQIVRCDLSATDSEGYFFETVLTSQQVDEGVNQKSMTHIIHLYPPLDFYNILPVPITIEQPVAMDLNPGENVTLNVIPGSRIVLWASYLGEMYRLDMTVPDQKKDVDVVALNTESGSAELLLGINWSHEHGDQKAYLYAPFWLVNNTSMTLRHMECGGGFIASSAKGCVPCGKNLPSPEENDMSLKHLPDENPLVLPFPTTDLSKKKKARVQIEGHSGWSEEFPLDTVGNAARIICKGEDRDYELTVDIKLCQSGLTKIVTFCPFYLVSNLSKFDMEVKEDCFENWITILAEKCIGVWPHSRGKKKLLCARYSGSTEESLLFPIVENFETLCEVDNDYVGINVTVSTGESSVAIHLASFQPGMCPACVINNLKIPVSFAQKGRSPTTVGQNELAYFTWSNIIEERLMELNCGDWKGEDKLETNRFLDLKPDSSKNRCVYFVSFLVGRQRTILFTDDLDIGMCAFGSWETDKVDMQAEISLQGFGLSIVDNLVGREILYLGISSSDILWEEEIKKGRFKPLAVKHMEQLEEKYQNQLVSPNPDFQPLENYQVNMATLIMKKKKSKEVKLRRIFEQGIWMSYGKSAQRTRMHFKINHLQIDNQLNACVFPRVLAVVPPPKSIVADNAPKPFIELSLLQRQSEYSSVPEVEYGRALIQEFSIQVDQGLINALLALVANQVNQKPYGKEMFDADLAMSCVRLEDTAQAYKTQRPKSFYNDLHISPLMIHLSFSQGGVSGESAGMMPIQSEFINLFIKSVGVSLTELQDVVFKLAYFERRCMFYSPDQLNAEIVNHYTKQFLKQLYVLVLGLDIIGNPFGLVRDLSAGVEDLFYQPFQGAIQGPEELVQGLTLGVSSLFGHTVGGAAGAVGRITGTVGKGVAALTFDDEYQKKRQEEINRKPQTFSEGMARGMKGLGMGVVDGITGVVTKPIEGARQDGARGLFKGVGKGLIGVVTRPVSGVVDFASSTMGAVRTVAGSHRDTEALRPPRVIKADKVVRPYSAAEALGFKIFKETDRGSLFETDEFITFAPITDKIILLVTKKQLVRAVIQKNCCTNTKVTVPNQNVLGARKCLAKRTDVMGLWAIDWQTEWIKMQEPQIIPGGMKILLKEKKRGFLGFGASDGKIFTFENAEMIQQKILHAYRLAVL